MLSFVCGCDGGQGLFEGTSWGCGGVERKDVDLCVCGEFCVCILGVSVRGCVRE